MLPFSDAALLFTETQNRHGNNEENQISGLSIFFNPARKKKIKRYIFNAVSLICMKDFFHPRPDIVLFQRFL